MRKIINILSLLIYSFIGCRDINRSNQGNNEVKITRPQAVSIFKVDFQRKGCLGIEKSILTVYREKDSIVTRLVTNDSLIKESKLDYPFQSVIPAFVNELKNIESKGSCTTVDSYIVYVDNEVIKMNIPGCDWNGFAGLKRALLNISE